MEQEYEYLLHLLGACVRGEVPQSPEGLDWPKLTELARIHGVLGFLGYMAMRHPICPDAQINAALRGAVYGTVARFAQRGDQAQALLQALDRAGIDHIPVKGYELRQLYPVPELRSFNDIDIFIHPEDRERCHDLMLSLGFQTHTDWEPVFSYFKGQELYELHTELMEVDVSEEGDLRGYFRDPWQHARPATEHSYRLVPEYHFLYLLCHIAKHVHGAGAGVRMYLDVAVFIRHYGEQADWPWIGTQLETLKLSQFAGVVLSAVETWFSVPCPMAHRMADPVVLNTFRDFTLEAGVFGHHNREDTMAGLKHTNPEKGSPRLRHLLRRAFPPAKTIQSRYTYLQKKPWLLPVAWGHRLIKTSSHLGEHAREARQILHADPEAVQKLHKLMKDIGL